MMWVRLLEWENIDVWCRIVREESSGRFDYYVVESTFYNEYVKIMKELIKDREVCEL